jgi:hypothetical protein
LAGVFGIYAVIQLFFGIRFKTWGYMIVGLAYPKEMFLLTS